MKAFTRSFVILLAVMSIACGISSAAWSADSRSSEGQVVVVQEWNLFIRTASGEPLSFTPYRVFDGNAWGPSLPGKTVLPALESGEMVKVMWTLDEREGRRRIDSIQINSPIEGVLRGIAVSSSPVQLVVRPKDEPGTVTLNTNYVQIEKRWVPDPAIARKLANLPKNAKVTVAWKWDQEGRKRIMRLEVESTEVTPPPPPTRGIPR